MWKLFAREKSSPKLLVEPIKLVLDARKFKAAVDAERNVELTKINKLFDDRIKEYMEANVHDIRKFCLHKNVLHVLENNYGTHYGDFKQPVYEGFYCTTCGQYSAYTPETSKTITQASVEDIYTLYGIVHTD